MALSFCPKWGSTQHVVPDLCSFQQSHAKQLPGAVLHVTSAMPASAITQTQSRHSPMPALQDNYFYHDGLLEPSNNDLYYSDVSNLLTCVNPPLENSFSLSPAIFPSEEFNSWENQCISQGSECNFPGYLGGYVSNPYQALEPFQEMVSQPQLPGSQIPPTFTSDPADDLTVKKPSGEELSPQSIAARQRRRKIAAKLHELGKLVPGGTKMNTAEMLQAAFKYVKCLQAQVGILELMGSYQETNEETQSHKLQGLLASPGVQEKLYVKEKCMVPQVFVQTLANDPKIQCKPSIVEEIDQLMRAHR